MIFSISEYLIHPDDYICKYWKLFFIMASRAVSLFYSRIVFKKVNDNAKLFCKLYIGMLKKLIIKNVAKLRADIFLIFFGGDFILQKKKLYMKNFNDINSLN